MKQKWLATRELVDPADPELKFDVRLGFPERSEKGWRCAFRVKGLGQGKIKYSNGVDALQALINALECIATEIRESGRVLTWLGGDHGVRRHVPMFLGSEFANGIEALIEAKIKSFTESKKRALRNR